MSKGRGSKASGGRGVVFLNIGTKHLARLVVSLYSLRRHHSGPVTILDASPAGDRAHEILLRIVGDSRLGDIECRPVPLVAHRKHSAYCTKASLWRHAPYDTFLQVDADTVFAGDPSPLLEITADPAGPGYVVTRFADWQSLGPIVSGRIKQWTGVKCDGINVKVLVAKSLDAPHGAINTGVMGIRKGAAILRDWERLTDAGWRCSFGDEICAQLLIRIYPHTMVDDRWNCSPIYGRNKDKAVVWHFHGHKNVRRADGRGEQGHAIWWPLYSEAVRENIAGIREWTPAGDGRLADYLRVAATA